MKKEQKERFDILIGLNDRENLEQAIPTETFIKIITNICIENRVGFSIEKRKGGYILEDGNYVLEDSLCLSLIGVSEEQAIQIGTKLKEIGNQESVWITKETLEVISL